MKEPVVGVLLGEKDVTLVGTAHVSEKSREFVKEIVEQTKPDAIGVELCSKRYNALMKKNEWDSRKLTEVVRKGDFKLLLYQTILYWFQQKIGLETKVVPGSEMLEAIRIAEKKKIKLYLVDRDINETLTDMIDSMGWAEKIRLFSQLFGVIFSDEKISREEIEKLKSQKAINDLIGELETATPNVKKVLVDKRNAYIANEIRRIPEERITVFLGAGHINGVKKNLFKETTYSFVKKQRKFSIMDIVPLSIVLLLVFGFFKSPNLGGSMLLTYLGSVMIGALIGGLISLAHPLSILAGVFSAPVTVLHPLLASGMFAAVFQAKYSSPRVKDLKELTKIKGLKDFYRNKLAHLLLVFFLVNLATSVGTLLVFPLLIQILI